MFTLPKMGKRDKRRKVPLSRPGRSADHTASGQIGMEPRGVDKVMAVEPGRDGAGDIVLAVVDEQRGAGRDSEAAGREMIDRRIGLHHPLDS